MTNDIKAQATEDMEPKGKYIITLADVSSRAAKWMQTRIENLREAGRRDEALAMLRRFNERFFVSQQVVHNLVPTVGKSLFAQRLAGTTTYSGTVNKVALGSGSTTPAVGDTTLTTETYRNTILSATYADNVAYLTGFFTAAECNGTYAEVGLFVDGTASANTGQLFSHALAAITKSAIQTLTIDWVVTIA